ncbi:hypothetical protein F4778DRAFT_232561 [Xylariomycetidae sp. FL2044]|nr:hypothetical protein F4778DRAFT_232561 [Xylariomycetidae sp. FL2044]
MKYTGVIAFFALAVSAATLKPRQSLEMDISNFSASTNPEGNGASISYDLTIPNVLSSTHCAYTDQTSTSDLPAISFTPCDDVAVEWQFHQDPSVPGAEGRYRIVITYADGSGARKAGFHEWAPTDFPEVDDETGYSGPGEFVIADVS